MVTGLLPSGADRIQAGPHRLPVDMHGAGAALRDAAAELGAGHAQNIPDDPEQRHVSGHIHLMRLAIHKQSDHSRAP